MPTRTMIVLEKSALSLSAPPFPRCIYFALGSTVTFVLQLISSEKLGASSSSAIYQ